ncbi:MAG: LysR family transcriptional regulator [Pseudomonadota bacterium]
MEYFVTALRHGNITRAAAELNIATSAVGAAIDQLEAAFGLTLVTRQRAKGIQPTAGGLEVARKCERLLEDYRTVLSETAELGQSLGGTLRIGYYAPVAPAFLPRVLKDFVPNPDRVTLHLTECDNDRAQAGLLDGSFDVILFVSDDVLPSLPFDTLIEAPPYCLLPKGHPLAARAAVPISKIAKEPLVVLDRPVAGPYYHALFEATHNKVSIAAYANSTEMLRALVGAGFGCAVLNMRPHTAQTYAGDVVVARPIDGDLRPLTLSIGYDKARPRELVRRFVAACKDAFSAQNGERYVVKANGIE